jgi:hypothetical protein
MVSFEVASSACASDRSSCSRNYFAFNSVVQHSRLCIRLTLSLRLADSSFTVYIHNTAQTNLQIVPTLPGQHLQDHRHLPTISTVARTPSMPSHYTCQPPSPFRPQSKAKMRSTHNFRASQPRKSRKSKLASAAQMIHAYQNLYPS